MIKTLLYWFTSSKSKANSLTKQRQTDWNNRKRVWKTPCISALVIRNTAFLNKSKKEFIIWNLHPDLSLGIIIKLVQEKYLQDTSTLINGGTFGGFTKRKWEWPKRIEWNPKGMYTRLHFSSSSGIDNVAFSDTTIIRNVKLKSRRRESREVSATKVTVNRKLSVTNVWLQLMQLCCEHCGQWTPCCLLLFQTSLLFRRKYS